MVAEIKRKINVNGRVIFNGNTLSKNRDGSYNVGIQMKGESYYVRIDKDAGNKILSSIVGNKTIKFFRVVGKMYEFGAPLNRTDLRGVFISETRRASVC